MATHPFFVLIHGALQFGAATRLILLMAIATWLSAGQPANKVGEVVSYLAKGLKLRGPGRIRGRFFFHSCFFNAKSMSALNVKTHIKHKKSMNFSVSPRPNARLRYDVSAFDVNTNVEYTNSIANCHLA